METQLALDGARVTYDVEGSGPVLVLVGLPMTAAGFEDLRAELVADHTVVTLDPRGFGRSVVDDTEADVEPRACADDLAGVLEAVSGEPVAVFGSSGGAITALDLAARRPELVHTVVAHEPPLLSVLDDAAGERSLMEQVRAVYREHGVGAGFAAFVSAVSGTPLPPAGPQPAPPFGSVTEAHDAERFLARNLLSVPGHVLDLGALRESAVRVVVAVGGESGSAELPRRTGEALAGALGQEPAAFPGGHAGFHALQGGDPPAFAARLREVLAATPS